MKQILLIDGNNLAHRAHWTRRTLRSHGFPTSALAGTLSMLGTIARRMPDTPMLWVWDGGGMTWRHRLLERRKQRNPRTVAYKGQRRDAQQQEHSKVDLQLPILRKFIDEIMGFRSIRIPTIEADDIIGVLSHELPKQCCDKVVIYSTDRDFFQLISEKVDVWRPVAEEKVPTLITDDKVKREFKISISQWVKYRALCGDKSDRIPNAAKGIGPKTAARLVKDGVDASAAEWDAMPFIVRTNEKAKALQEVWHDVHENYLLCRIPREVKSFPLEIRTAMQYCVDCCEKRGVARADRGSYEEMVKFLARYELREAYERRANLWSIL